jgi:hypothetical protein
MSYQIGTATGYDDLLNQLDSFLTGQGMCLTPSFSGVGNGTISGPIAGQSAIGGSAAVAETISIAFTSSTAFTVTGSVTGAIGTGTVGTPFTSTKINFTITAGGTAFSSGDQFTVATTPPWTSLQRNAGSQMIWQAPGNGGLDQIIVGASAFTNVAADYYNWRLGGFTGFNSGSPFNQQPGYLSNSQAQSSPSLNLWNNSTPYWFIANGRRVIVVAKVSTVYVAAYLGLLNSYISPGSFPLPLVVAGSVAWNGEPALTSANWRWSYSGAEITDFPIPISSIASGDFQSQLRLRLPSGVWRGFDVLYTESVYGRVWPYFTGFTGWTPNLDGSYALLPIVLSDAAPNVYGELDGIAAVAGFGNGSENTIAIGGVNWLVVQNVFRTTQGSYFAVRLA